MTFVQKVIFCRVESLTLAIEKYVRIEKNGCFTLFTSTQNYKGSVHTAFMNINAKTLFERILQKQDNHVEFSSFKSVSWFIVC